MKKKKWLAAAMASVALTGALGSCDFNPLHNDEPTVYGPPPSYEDPDDRVSSGMMNEMSSGTYDPERNIEPDVYGPPDPYEEPEEPEDTVTEPVASGSADRS